MRNRIKAIICVQLFISILAGILYGQDFMHPGFTAETLNITSGVNLAQEHGIVGLDFLSDGRMVVATWGGDKKQTQSKGKVFILDNADGPSKNVTAVEIAGGFKDPVGMMVLDDVIYVTDKDGIQKITLQGVKTQLLSVPFSGNYHEYHFGLVEKDGYFYHTLGQAWLSSTTFLDSEDRGACKKTSVADGTSENIAGGLREINGMGWGPEGILLATDDEGNWNPACNLVHIEEGDFFGFRSNLQTPFLNTNPKDKPPVAWFPHDIVASSVTQPLLIEEGEFAGQLYVGEYTMCRLFRVFLEEVDGQWQGTVFIVLNAPPMTSPPNRLKWGPDGDLYLGGMGHIGEPWPVDCPEVVAGNSSDGFWSTIQKLSPTDVVAFEMKAVRSLADGFEIEFTKPVNAEAENTQNYEIFRSGWKPEVTYGGGALLNQYGIPITSAVLVSDTRVKLTLNPDYLVHDPKMMPSTLFEFILNNKITAKSNGEPLWTHQTWYTLNEIGPGRDPEPSVSTGKRGAVLSSVTLQPFGKGRIRVGLPNRDSYEVELLDLQGRHLDGVQRGRGNDGDVVMTAGNSGVYIIRTKTSDGLFSRKVFIH